MSDEISYTDYQREVYDHERQTGQHAFECDPDESAGFSVKVPNATCIATYNIQIMSPDLQHFSRWSLTDKRVLSNLPAIMESVEEDLTNLLPEGYEARITEWSSE